MHCPADKGPGLNIPDNLSTHSPSFHIYGINERHLTLVDVGRSSLLALYERVVDLLKNSLALASLLHHETGAGIAPARASPDDGVPC